MPTNEFNENKILVRDSIPYLPNYIDIFQVEELMECKNCGTELALGDNALIYEKKYRKTNETSYKCIWCIDCGKQYYNDPSYTKGKKQTRPIVIDI
jgi:uncharacterized protein with PIN domain